MPHQVFKEKVLGVTAERQNTQWVTWQTRAEEHKGHKAAPVLSTDLQPGRLSPRAAGGSLEKGWGYQCMGISKVHCMEKNIRNWTLVLVWQAPDGCSESESSGDPRALLYHSLIEVWGNTWSWKSSKGSSLWLPDEMSPCNSSLNLSSCSNPSPGHGHNWSFGHVNLTRFPKSGWTSHLQQTSGVSCSSGYLNFEVSSRVSRCFAIRQLLTSFQQLFSSTAHVIFPTFFSTKRSSSLPGKTFSFPTKHYPKISHWALSFN